MMERKPTSLAAVLLFLLICSHGQADAAKCEGLYAASYDATAMPLTCGPFAGDPTLHAIVYGCKNLNQGDTPETGSTVQTFTQICTAEIASDTNYTCYELAADTDYTAFEAAVAANDVSSCSGEDEPEAPIYRYLQTTAEYTFSGEAGGQSTAGPADATFRTDFAAEAYYVVTVKEGEALQYNDPTDAAPMGDHSDNGGNTTDSGSDGGDGEGSSGSGGDSDGSSGGDGEGSSGGGESDVKESSAGVQLGGMTTIFYLTLLGWVITSKNN
ncbi:expressed unknown protein [Seminavis robusta]|uniref:Uncharacterized protein n=1 Tax=Seminavis robusta TaxID=568900 RepID=A0A9N8DTT5_9STRA|nr:expressed unknown protein [Seminavis robusta]|eukprot:Sro352_g124210.1 n/a (270) ;mRNA; f:31513-32322